ILVAGNVRAVEFTTCTIAGQVALEGSGRRRPRRTSGADHLVRPVPYNVAGCAPLTEFGPSVTMTGNGSPNF
ncbi:MAG: hypothetical protein M3Y48_23305, partial [Actinomycetota bacterium]|nr:hypothetical protein [Actinomycetota bacterium]